MKKCMRQLAVLWILCLLLTMSAFAAPTAAGDTSLIAAVDLTQGVEGAEGCLATVSSPVVLGGKIYVALQMKTSSWNEDWTVETVTFRKTQLVCIGTDGTVESRADLTGGTYYTIPIAADGHAVYVGLEGGRVAKVDVDTMTQEWITPDIQASVTTGFAIADGKLYHGVYTYGAGSFVTVDTATGSVSYSSGASSYGTTPVVCGDQVFLGAEDGHVYGYSRADGRQTADLDCSSGGASVRCGFTPVGGSSFLISNTAGHTFTLDLSAPAVTGDETYGDINRITDTSVRSSDGRFVYTVGENYDPSGWGTVMGGYISVKGDGEISLPLPNHSKSNPILVEDPENGINYLYVALNYNGTTYENDGSLLVIRHDTVNGTVTAEKIFTPEASCLNASTSSVAQPDGDTLVYTNDSGYLFIVGTSRQNEDLPGRDPSAEETEKDDSGEPNPDTGDGMIVWMSLTLLAGGAMVPLHRKNRG